MKAGRRLASTSHTAYRSQMEHGMDEKYPMMPGGLWRSPDGATKNNRPSPIDGRCLCDFDTSEQLLPMPHGQRRTESRPEGTHGDGADYYVVPFVLEGDIPQIISTTQKMVK
ncbi:unnamed protein product [Prorocentrum cordatum]|uniref:Uncharacterized protein n=1 Tax=Prorocentrum cordatum TaxID=2364126 RepID=A0ABN9V330_9DINO|nr:unnamed protein product [Polarella glacialis]